MFSPAYSIGAFIVRVGRYFRMSCSGSRDGANRCSGSLHVAPLEWWDFWECVERCDCPSDARVVLDADSGALEDMIWVDGEIHVVSSCLRRCFESLAPGAAQYLSIPIVDHHGDLCSGDYFLVNWLVMSDCIDEQKSVYYSKDRKILIGVIDPSRISAPISRVRGFAIWTLVGETVKQILEEAAFTGVQFYDVWHSADPFSGPRRPLFPC